MGAGAGDLDVRLLVPGSVVAGAVGPVVDLEAQDRVVARRVLPIERERSRPEDPTPFFPQISLIFPSTSGNQGTPYAYVIVKDHT